MNETLLAHLKRKSTQLKREIIEMVYRANSGHIGGSLGAADIVTVLYYHIMNHRPADPAWPGRDRFTLSKGHCTPVLYAALADCGYFPKEDLGTFRRIGSHLQGHPYQPKTPGVEVSTGTLGLGISTAVGMALGAKVRNENHFYYVLCGDGEIQEGQVWEAAMFANKYKLDNVIVIVDRNYLQTDGYSEDIMPLDPLLPKWASFGWSVKTVDGHDIQALIATISEMKQEKGRPHVIIANTVKGKGVSFMENEASWHGNPPNEKDYLMAMEELAHGI